MSFIKPSSNDNYSANNVSNLVNKYEQIGKQSTQETQKARIRSHSVNTTPPKSPTTQKSIVTADGLAESGKNDRLRRSRSKSLPGRVTKDTHIPVKLAPILNRTGVSQPANSSRLNGNNHSNSGNGPVPNNYKAIFSAHSSEDKKMQEVSGKISLLNMEVKRQSMNVGKMSPPDFQKAIEQASGSLADRVLNAGTDAPSKAEVKELQNKLQALAKPFPELSKKIDREQRVASGLVETMDKKDLKSTYKETISSLCQKHGLTEADVSKEAKMLGTDNETAMTKMVERLITHKKGGISSGQSPSLVQRAETTGYELSVVKGVEKTFKNFIQGKIESDMVKLEGGFTVIPYKGGAIVEEKKLGEGGFKSAILASNYFSVATAEERKQFVSLKPKTLDKTEPAPEASIESARPPPAESINVSLNAESGSTRIVNDEFSSTRIVNDEFSSTRIVNDEFSSTRIVNDEFSSTRIVNDEFSSTRIVNDEFSSTRIVNDENSSTRIDSNAQVNSGPYMGPTVNAAKEPTIEELSKMPVQELRLSQMTKLLHGLEGELNGKQGTLSAENSALSHQIVDLKAHISKREQEIILLNSYASESDTELYKKEIALTKELQGDHVIKVHAVVNLASGDKIMVQEAAGFKMEGVEGNPTIVDLDGMRKLNKKGQLAPEQRIHMMEMFLEGFKGVERMHDMGYIHRDLKEENILITKDGHGALADFGASVKKADDPRKAEYSGTPRYSAPEAHRYYDHELWNTVSEKSDLWSCGMMVQNVFIEGQKLTDHPLFGGKEMNVALYREMSNIWVEHQGDYNKKYAEPENKNSFEHLVWSCTRLNPNERPTMKEFNQRFEAIINLEKEKLAKESK